MAKPFDATLNQLIDDHAAGWARFLCERLGLPFGPVEVLDTDLSTTLQADKVFRLGGDRPALLHLELETGGRLGIPRDLLRYNVLLGHQHELPVHSVIILLRRQGNPSDLTGQLDLLGRDGRPYLQFRYGVVRLWAEPFEPLRSGELGLVPLALLTDEAAENLPGAFQLVEERIQREPPQSEVVIGLRSAAYFLLGLRYDEGTIENLYRSATMLEESTTYQATIRKGEIRAHQRDLLRIGGRRFGPAKPEIENALRAIVDCERLDRMVGRVLDVATWEELLATQ